MWVCRVGGKHRARSWAVPYTWICVTPRPPSWWTQKRRPLVVRTVKKKCTRSQITIFAGMGSLWRASVWLMLVSLVIMIPYSCLVARWCFIDFNLPRSKQVVVRLPFSKYAFRIDALRNFLLVNTMASPSFSMSGSFCSSGDNLSETSLIAWHASSLT